MVTIARPHVPRIVLQLHSLVFSVLDGQHQMAKNLVATLSPSKQVKKSQTLQGNEVQTSTPYSVISLNVLNCLTQQKDKLFDPLSAGSFGYVLSTSC
jgi:hypothetical protein